MQAALESFLYRTFRLNPAVTVLELRTRLRGPRAYGVLFFYAFMACLTFVIAYLILDYPRRLGQANVTDTALGDTALMVLAMTQLTLLFLIVPAYAGGSIALEREKQTLGLVQATLLSPADIVSGKLLVTLAFAGILLLASLPVAAWCMMLGGVSPRQLFFVYTFLAATALTLTAFGLVMSALSRGTMSAVVTTYGLILAVHIAGPFLIISIYEMLRMATTSRMHTLGLGGAALVLLIVCGMLGWLVFLILRGLTRRLAPLRRGFWGIFSPSVIAVIVALGVGAILANTLLTPLSSLEPQGILLLHPYMALAAILQPGLADDMISGSGGPTATVDWSLVIWALSMVLALFTGVFMWLVAISAFRWRSIERA